MARRDRPEHWILLCTAPLASQYLAKAAEDYREEHDVDYPPIMTVNAGFRLHSTVFPGRVPRAYTAVEIDVLQMMKSEIKEMAHMGTTVYTWPSRVNDIHGVRATAIPYNGGGGGRNPEWLARQRNEFYPDGFTHMHCVGLTALQLLLHTIKAKSVKVVGMAGYDIDQLYDPVCKHTTVSPVDKARCEQLNTLAFEYSQPLLEYYRGKGRKIEFYGKTIHDQNSIVDPNLEP